MHRALLVIGGLLVLVFILFIIWLLRKVLRAFSGTSCPEPECSGTMKPETIPHGHVRQPTPCLVCDCCGHIELLPELVSR